jgi:hypothetical protein
MAIGIAVLGAGIFAREGGFDFITEALSPFWQANSDSSILATAEHVPAVQACSLLSLKAIYSRSPRSAKELAAVQALKHTLILPLHPRTLSMTS